LLNKQLKKLFEHPSLSLGGKKPPRTHTATELYTIPPKESGSTLPSGLERQPRILNKCCTATRYLDAANDLSSGSVDRVEARRSCDLAREVLECVGERFLEL